MGSVELLVGSSKNDGKHILGEQGNLFGDIGR